MSAAVQWVAEALPVDKAVQQDLSEMSKAMQEESAAGFLGFDVATNPLFRCWRGPGAGAGRRLGCGQVELAVKASLQCVLALAAS